MAPTKGDKTKTRILEASKKLILKQGYNATSMRNIAEETNITPGAIYNHFQGKEEIFEALLEESLPLLTVSSQLTEIPVEEPIEALRLAIRIITESLISHEDYIRLGLIDAQEREGRNIKKMLPRLYPVFRGFLLKVKEKDPELFIDVPVETMLRVLVSLVFGYVYTEVVANPCEQLPLPDIDWVDALVDVFTYGIVRR